MITEDYVSFEVANLLKEKGFNEPCFQMWECGPDKKYLFRLQSSCYQNITEEDSCLAPTYQMAVKWLREAHNIDIEVHAEVGMLGVKVYIPFISRYKSSTEHPSKLRQYKNGLHYKDDKGVIPALQYFDSYEEAVEAALKYSLKNFI